MMRRIVLIAVLTMSTGCLGCSDPKPKPLPPARGAWPPARPGYVNPIPAENALPGDASWFDGREAIAEQIEGYADRISATAGQPVQVMVQSDSPHQMHWSLYRLGWYGGARARQVLDGTNVSIAPQPACPEDPSTGLIQCHWTPSFSFMVQPQWVSGLYVLKFVRDDAYTSYAPLVITDNRPADLLMQASVQTYQAYNGWHGESLYQDDTGLLLDGLGIKVSFDRPYASDRGTGEVMRYEMLFAGFLEQNGYDVTYTSDPDVAAGGEAYLAARGAFLTVGHDEYWVGAERDAVQSARDAGVPVLFFGANQGYWKVRYEQAAEPNNPRVLTCYKANPYADPVTGADATGEFRNPPINNPENALVGTMYESWELIASSWTVADPKSFLYAGTGLNAGDQIPFMVGYEYDRTMDNGAQPTVDVVARSPVVDAFGIPSVSEAVTYQGPRGSLVFGAASIYYSYGMGQPGVTDNRVARMTANLLNAALNLPIPAGLQNVSAPPPPSVVRTHGASSIQTVTHGLSSPTAVAQLADGSFYTIDPQLNQLFHSGPTDATKPQLIAGDGKPSSKSEYDHVPGLTARFRQPTGLVMLPSGLLVVSDTENHCLRTVTADSNHTVATVAGTMGSGGNQDGTGTSARFKDPLGLALDPATGDILVADSGNSSIRRVNPQTWAVTTEAGNGAGNSDGPAIRDAVHPTDARFDIPTALAVAADGRIFVVDSGNARIAVIGTDPSRMVVTLVNAYPGRTDGTGDQASVASQGGAVWDGTALYVSDPSTSRIRRITPGVDAPSTTVETWAGSGVFGSADGPGDQGQLALPLGLTLTSDHAVLVANGGNGTVRRVSF